MPDRNYTKQTEIINLILIRDNLVINTKKTYISLKSLRQLERYRVMFENKLNSIYKVNCKIDFHYRDKYE
jgi:hypothetical protein